MNIDSAELIYLVLGPGVLVLIAILLRVDLKLKRHYDELATRMMEAEGRLSVLQALENDDTRERELEERVDLLVRQYEQLMLRDAETGPYFRAVRIAEKGASVDSMIEQTGVTRVEAELIHKLHGIEMPAVVADRTLAAG